MILDQNEKITGEKVILRSLEEADLHGPYPDWFNDPEVCRFNAHGVEINTKEKTLTYIRNSRASSSTLVFAILDRETMNHIGNVTLQSIDLRNSRAEVAIILGEKSHWGKGYAREAWLLAMNYAFENLKLNRLYCGTREDNLGMQKIAIATGMKKEGLLRKHIFKDGKFYDQISYGALADER
jgi:ribosomal-protein-alanine N-acetyltransferase